VPIRDENLFLSPTQNFVEVGHTFEVAASQTLTDGRFYLNTLPSAYSLYETVQVSIYPQGTEDETGPVHSVIIPVSNGAITGNAAITGASTVVDALASPSDISAVQLSGGSPTSANVDLYFAVNAYSNLLSGKRILKVEMLYTASAGNFTDFSARAGIFQVPQAAGILYGATAASSGTGINEIVAPEGGFSRPQYQSLPMGEVSPFWSTTPMAVTEWLPWTYTTLQRFELAAANRLTFRFNSTSNTSGVLVLQYVAMRVTYCEEKRVAVASQAFGDAALTNVPTRAYILGANAMPMRTATTLALNPVLTAGTYTVVLSAPETGALNMTQVPYPLLNAVRQLQEIPSHHGVQVNVTRTEGETFTTQPTDVLPQLSLHTSTGPLTAVHVYGRQAAAEVYGSITATQEILDSGYTSAQYPQVRFYARRFGDTTIPLKLTYTAFPAINASITPADFDDLDEIIDGWKEVTLRFVSIPSMGGAGNPQWTFSAAGEGVGNRWEVLGAAAPAMSGVPGNLLNLVPSPNQLSIATYGQPVSGAGINLGWMPQLGPYVTSTTDDQTADAALIFSQDMPTITGLAAVGASQEVVGIGLDCGLDPCCIPTAINYNWITWPSQAGVLGYLNDTFTRTLSNSWGSTDTGQAYTLTGTAADFDVTGTQGTISPTTLSSRRIAVVDTSSADHTVAVEVSVATLPVTGVFDIATVLRYTDASNFYWGGISIASTGAITYFVSKIVAGVVSSVVSTASGTNYTAGTTMSLRTRILGAELQFRVWETDTDEPDYWSFSATDTSLTTGNLAGVLVNDTSNITDTFLFDNLVITNAFYVSGYIELQRMDTVETDWQTIMKATSPLVTGFSDYEARVGIQSSYRIRNVNVLEFAGPWSSTVTITSTAPGISGGCVSEGHVLIFTSNERQDGSINLAYASVWEGRVEEGFAFPEANFVQMQAMYNRDFFTAFRPTERGGEQFSRTVLVQAAAIDPETLADFTGLRDMAWEDVSYICVRDEDGNRWFATVIVPAGRVLLDRRLYLAPVNIIEVTATPSPVDP
jgi:hypothetical protein